MFYKNLVVVFILGLIFTFVSSLNAQEKPTEIKENKVMMQHDKMQKCMDQIAADSTLRMQMMDKMMAHNKGDKDAMMKMCKKMMDNPEMHKMMLNMMQSEGMMKQDMMADSTKVMNK